MFQRQVSVTVSGTCLLTACLIYMGCNSQYLPPDLFVSFIACCESRHTFSRLTTCLIKNRRKLTHVYLSGQSEVNHISSSLFLFLLLLFLAAVNTENGFWHKKFHLSSKRQALNSHTATLMHRALN